MELNRWTISALRMITLWAGSVFGTEYHILVCDLRSAWGGRHFRMCNVAPSLSLEKSELMQVER